MADQSPDGLYPVRLPFAGDETGRDAAFTKDRYYKNLFIEEYKDKRVIVKRPGLELYDDGGDTCHDGVAGLGLYNWEGILISVFGNTIYSETIGAPVVWTRVTDMPAARHSNYGAIDGDYFYSFGGNSSTTAGAAASSAVYRYTKSSDTWVSLTTMPQGGRQELIAILLPNGSFYIGGGTTTEGSYANSSNVVYWYNPNTDVWTAKNNLPFAWGDARVVSLQNGKLLLCGGRNTAGTFLSATYLYNHADDAYTAVASMNTARSNHALVVLDDGRVMAIGGHPSGSLSTTSTEIYDPATDTWTAKAALPSAIQYHSAAASNGYVYVWGGRSSTNATDSVSTIYAYSVERNSWETLVSFPIAFSAAAYDRFDDGVYINAGGYNPTDGVSARVYITGGDGSGTPTVQCTSLSTITEGEAGVSFAELFATNTQLIVKTSKKMYVITRSTLAVNAVTDVDYPATTVPGVVTLDGYVFVMDADGTIYNSDLETPTAWNALNFINAEIESDNGVALTKHLNYVLALGARSYELFDNAANPTGSPLARIEQAFKPIGCIAPWSVAHIGELTLWIGSQSHDDPVVVLLQGFEYKIISDPVVQRVLKSYGGDLQYAKGLFVPVGGHQFYVIQLGRYWNQFDRTLVYDLESLKWYEWTTVYDTGESAFNISSSTIFEGQTLASGIYDGFVYRLSTDQYRDGTQNINFEARTEPWDGGVAVRKFVARAKLIGDLQTVSGATIDLDYSDDNYKTFSTARSLSLVTLTGISRLGSTDRRVWRVKSTANAPIRLDGLDIVFSPGDYMV